MLLCGVSHGKLSGGHFHPGPLNPFEVGAGNPGHKIRRETFWGSTPAKSPQSWVQGLPHVFLGRTPRKCSLLATGGQAKRRGWVSWVRGVARANGNNMHRDDTVQNRTSAITFAHGVLKVNMAALSEEEFSPSSLK